jgi:hypothetical protein
MSKPTRRALFVVLTLLLFRSCSQPVFVDIVDSSDPSYPAFCVSTSKLLCRGGFEPPSLQQFDVSLSNLDLDIKNPNGDIPPEVHWQRIVWAIEPAAEGYPPKFSMVRYGVPPPGWKTLKPARPIERGKLYQVEMTLFACFGEKPNGACRIYSWEEYWDHVRRKAPIEQ